MNWKNKKVLITGGTGFIGSKLTEKLLNKGADIIVLDKTILPCNPKVHISPPDRISGDISSFNLHRLEPVDYIFHFGAPSSVILFIRNPWQCIHQTVCGFANILDWGKEIGVKKIIYPSSGSIYGDTPPPQSEDSVPLPKNLYGACKLSCELLAKQYTDVPSVGLRIFAGYGPGEGHKGDFSSVVTLFLRSILSSKQPVIYGDGTQSRDFVYIDDVITAIITTAEKNIKNEIINVGSGDAYSFNEVISTINRLVSKNIRPKYIDKPTNYLENTLADTKKMEKMLNLKPLSLERGIKKYIQEIRK